MLYQTQCCGLLGIEMLTEIKHMTHLGKRPHKGHLGLETQYQRLARFVGFKPTSYKQAKR